MPEPRMPDQRVPAARPRVDLRQVARDPWVWGQVILIAGIGIGVPLLVGTRPGPQRVAGLALLLAGAMAIGAGLRSLGRSLTPSVVPVEGGELVERGAYGLVRHPIYAGLILVLAGWGLLMGTWWSGAVAALAAFAWFDRKATAEERLLVQRYPGYAEYRRRVPKLVPRL